MTSLTDNNAAYALRSVEVGAQTVAHGWGRYLTTVAFRICALVVAPALFWSSIIAIIY